MRQPTSSIFILHQDSISFIVTPSLIFLLVRGQLWLNRVHWWDHVQVGPHIKSVDHVGTISLPGHPAENGKENMYLESAGYKLYILV